MNAEALALLKGLKICRSLDLKKVDIEVDSAILAQIVLKEVSPPHMVKAMVLQIFWLTLAVILGNSCYFSSGNSLPNWLRGIVRIDRAG